MKKYAWGKDPEFFGPQMYYRLRRIIDLLSTYMRRGIVLDAGCGDGLLSFMMQKAGFTVHAVDAASSCIQFIRSKVKSKRISGLLAQKASLLDLPFKNNYFDGITCGEVLEHISADEKVIQEFFRVLKPRGVCVITTPGKPALWHEVDDISGHVRRYTNAELRKKFEIMGFIVDECYYWGFPLNGLWHRFVFKPCILHKMKTNTNITHSDSVLARVIKANHLQRLASGIFGIDRLFDWTGMGEFLLLVAHKPNKPL